MSTILVVDDMPAFRTPIAAALRLRGHEVIDANNGIEAIERVGDNDIDLILLDVAMPRMDGLTFLTEIRKDPQKKTIPVILMTGVSEKDYIARATELGVNDSLLKSRFSVQELYDHVDRQLACQTQR